MRKKHDAAARRARARELRMQIEGLKSGKETGAGAGGSEESPKEFVERRARELLEAEQKGKAKRARNKGKKGAGKKKGSGS